MLSQLTYLNSAQDNSNFLNNGGGIFVNKKQNYQFQEKNIDREKRFLKDINDSIFYAKRIQDGIMCKESHLENVFPSAFTFYKPKDILSGDFYWVAQIQDKIVVAVADCTGHGVPGAFMSILGISLLNQIVLEEKNTDVSFILHLLDKRLRKTFLNSYETSFAENLFDGMDIAICSFDSTRDTLTFAGAYRPIFHYTGDAIVQYDGQVCSIGGDKNMKYKDYESRTIQYKKGDRIFLFTDGYADQFGGMFNKKFMSKKFKQYLFDSSLYSMQEQKNALEKTFVDWKGDSDQTDDVLVLGIEL